ncbi:MAG: hypothetical protein WAQ08_02120 [Aquabacterium sp.]|jgi:hypothetical protein|uniref:hypothetical protein n=1 Tax=Aquabacterium sp. TaxID=1872578 RepID=UPI003BB14547
MATASILTQTVHQRTRKGQMVAAAQPPMLDEAHTMLLRLFNGFTPTEWLVEKASVFLAQPDVIAQELERSGLIERVH